MTAREASDRLSPIIVKELRQGVRGHLFTGAFLLQQLLLLGIAGLGLLMDTSAGNRDMFTFFFWAFVTIPLVLILPLGAAVSISGELSANTLEPVLLTRLTPWRLAAGKWAATASQALVLAVSTLPFVLVRYYLGGIEIVADLFFLGAYVCCSLLLASVAVAISPARMSALFRWVLMAVLGLLLGIPLMASLAAVIFLPYGGAPLAVPKAGPVLLFLAVVVTVLLAALEAAALQIAPAATARPLRLRLLALAALAATALALSSPPLGEVDGMAVVWALVLVTAIAIAALCEPAPLLRSRYAGFLRRRAFVPLGWFLAPGWPAGVGFTILVAALAGIAVAPTEHVRGAVVLFLGLLGTLLLPLVVWRTFVPRAPSFAVFLLVTLVSGAFSVVAPIGMHLASERWWRAGYALLPLCPAAYAMARLKWYGGYGYAPSTTVPPAMDAVFAVLVALVLGAALWHTVHAWRRIDRLVRPQLPSP
jgi:hypothetical protein